VASVAGLLLVASAAVWGHAEWQPAQVLPGTRPLMLVVPPEKADVDNERIDLELLPDFTFVACDAPTGWSCETSGSGRAQVVSFLRQVALASESRFGVQLDVPDAAGDHVFAVTQTYDDGTGVHWAGPPGDEFEGAVLRVLGERAPSPPPASSSAPPAGPARTGAGGGPSLTATPPAAGVPGSPAPQPAETPAAQSSPSAAAPSGTPTPPPQTAAAAPFPPRSPGRFVLPTGGGTPDGGLGQRLVVLLAGMLLLASVLGHAAVAARHAGRGRAGRRRVG
jgi:hypothetical protein